MILTFVYLTSQLMKYVTSMILLIETALQIFKYTSYIEKSFVVHFTSKSNLTIRKVDVSE